MPIGKPVRWLLICLLMIISFAALSWSCLAIIIDGPQNIWGKIAAALYVCLQLASIFFLRPVKLGLCVCTLLFAGVCTWWFQIEPQNNRDWTPDVARMPEATFNGDLVTIRNVRNFDYQSETNFTERWEERTYDLSKVKGSDVFLSYWGPNWMAHAISSWEFNDGKHLAISIETRKEVGEEYSALLGFFRQYELYYVVADELDVIRLRTNFRNEQVYLYRLKDNSEVAKNLLIDYLKGINSLSSKPRWYNALTTNCSTAIRDQRSHVTDIKSWHWKMLANGYVDELAYTQGQIDTSLPFAEVKRNSFINDRAKSSTQAADFSKDIRRTALP